MTKIAFILDGCGMLDGSEIHESVCSLLAVDQANCEYKCFSLNKDQNVVFNHKTKEEVNEKRNMMAESARISRLRISDIKTLNVNEFDILFIPGGRGLGYNLCDYCIKGENYNVDPDVKRVILDFYKENKPICALCLAPILLNKVLKNIKITFGNDINMADLVNKSGNIHIETESGDICVDKENKILTSPCYMLAKSIKTIYEEATKIVSEAVKMIK